SESTESSPARSSSGSGVPAHPHRTVRSLGSVWNARPWSIAHTSPSESTSRCPPLRSALLMTRSNRAARRILGVTAWATTTSSPGALAAQDRDAIVGNVTEGMDVHGVGAHADSRGRLLDPALCHPGPSGAGGLDGLRHEVPPERGGHLERGDLPWGEAAGGEVDERSLAGGGFVHPRVALGVHAPEHGVAAGGDPLHDGELGRRRARAHGSMSS